jgi:D-lactate dehydrogenase (cytochrome)
MAWRRAASGWAAAAARLASNHPTAALAAGVAAACLLDAGVAAAGGGAAYAYTPPQRAVATPPPSPHADLVAALVAVVGADAVLTAPEEVAHYGRDEHGHHSGPPPDAVAFPSSTGDVSALVAACAARGVPIIPRGAGTSLEGHTTTPRGGVVLDLTRMDAVLAVRPEDLDATVQPGVPWQSLNAALAPHGLFFPMDPGPGACIGGMVGTGCSGTNAVRYGAMKANVLSLTVVLADGRVVKTSSRARKSVAGFDLTSLFTGSEGTLGIVTEATLRLAVLPEATAVAVAAFPSIRAASAATAAAVRSGVVLGAVELLDGPMVAAVNAQSGFDYAPMPHLFFKFSGSPAKVADDAARVEAVAAAHGGSAFAWTLDGAGQARLWEARKVALWSAAAMDPTARIATTDVCVPLSRLPDLMAAMEGAAAASPLKVYAVAHAGDGNAHHFIAFHPDVPAEVAEAARLNAFLVRTAISMDGTCEWAGWGGRAWVGEGVGGLGCGRGPMSHLPHARFPILPYPPRVQAQASTGAAWASWRTWRRSWARAT